MFKHNIWILLTFLYYAIKMGWNDQVEILKLN